MNPALFMHPFLVSYGHDVQKLTPHQLGVKPDSPEVQTVTGKTYISLFSKGSVDFEISVSGGEWVQPLLVNSLCTFQSGSSPDESKLFCKGQTGGSLLKLGLTFIADGQLSLTLHSQSQIILVPSIPTDDTDDIVRTFNDETYKQISRMAAQQEEQKKIDNLVKKRNQFLSTEPKWLQRQNEMRKKAEEIRKIHEGEALVIENDFSRDDREYQVTLKVPVYTPELVVFDPEFSYHGKLPAKFKFNTCGRNQRVKPGCKHQVHTRGQAKTGKKNSDGPLFQWPAFCELCQKGFYTKKKLEKHREKGRCKEPVPCSEQMEEQPEAHDLTDPDLKRPYSYEEWWAGFEGAEVKRKKKRQNNSNREEPKRVRRD
ncbi:hypothetical protein NX722_23305 [Endozoicomonas gorgoniicola]|uniref:C2H2-type domain-containing protein n=1 Tax=Endozoicomonas gorgoniicola TaxID=1234144 RepID=A0ABT3N1I9_9GAMM|nr:hypothetical protein [Endozoicomonas gorgoniicola]MCW7555497.1 hypothetical protein [Endozoicomonas gorgoniicola]